MANRMSLQESILNAVNTIVEQRTNELKVDKTITAIVEKNMGVFGGKALYKVMYEGGFFEAVVLNATETYLPNTSVYVLIPQGDFSKEKVIIGRANNINFDKEFTTIASAANQYSLVGSNLLYNANNDNEKLSNLQYGVYSYHSQEEEQDKPENILHRYNLICNYDSDLGYQQFINRKKENDKYIYDQNLGFNEESFEILKEQSTALMLKADFRTNLTREQRQQASGEYGLILNLVFKNLNQEYYGSTNGEIFEKIADIITGEAYISNSQAKDFNIPVLVAEDEENNYDYYTIKLKDIHNYYINQIKQSDDDIIKNNIRTLIEYTNNLKTTFSTNNSTKALYNDNINNVLTAYLGFLKELELSNDKNDFNERYNIWWNEIINDSENKVISYKFSSNNMLGNPLSFNQWNTQYQILNIDIKNLIRVDSIILYKQGFIEDSVSESQWPANGSGPDIFVKNLQLYPIKPIDSENGDYTLKVQPKNLENDSNADILMGVESTDIVTFEAIFMRRLLENLSRSNNISYYWFKEDFSVVDSNSAGYNVLAGTGWKEISSANGYTFTTTGTDNLAYKNNYKCVVKYVESEDNIIVLSTIFTIYNNSAAINILLESDLGTVFSFDAGIPEITCKINETSNISNEVEDYLEINATDELYPKYKYYWAVTDAANGNKIFLNDIDSRETNNMPFFTIAKDIVNNIKCFKLNNELEKIQTENSVEATRISYPVNKFSSGFTVECSVKKKISILGSDEIYYIDVGSANLEFLNKGLDIDLNTFKLSIENGKQVFQYDEYGDAPNSSKQKDPLRILPLYAKVYAPSGVEIQGSNYSVEWIFPTENTMIIAEETLEINSATQVPQLHRGMTCNFDIMKLYNSDYWNNQITCHVRYNNQDLYKDTEFLFTKIGENGTNGTDVTAKIDYIGNDLLNTLHNEPLTIYVQDINSADNVISKAMFNVPNGSNKMKSLEEELPIIGDNGILGVTLYQKGKELSNDNYAATYPRWTLLGNSSYSESYGKYFKIERNNNLNDSHNLYQISWNGSSCGEKQKWLYQIIKAEVKLQDTGQVYYAMYNLPIIWYTNKSEDILGIDYRIAIDRGNYLSSVLYNSDGRNPIYNHNQGLKFINIPQNITKIIWEAKGGEGEGNSPCFNFVLEDDTLTKTFEKEDVDVEEMIYILPDDIYDGGITNNHIKASFYNEENLIATAYVPIYMSLNTFGLASLNAWDGNHVTINEGENGYVVSPQIGAGEKDENNRFTGILMGKTEGEVGKSNKQDSQVGLFGYFKGIESMFLDAKTGSATFGLPSGISLNEEDNNNFNEGRIELHPGGESTIGGWTLGNRSLYYTSKKNADGEWVHSGKLEKRNSNDKPDYVPNWRTGLIEKDEEEKYSGHHEKDIKSDESGILLYAGENPYISIKGRPFKVEDIPQNEETKEKESFIKPDDSIELQLDPATPTLFTIFRHNGGNRKSTEGQAGEAENYEEGSRTFLAGVNSQGEFIANGLRNANTTDITLKNSDDTWTETWKAGSLITKFAVNALSAFDDFENIQAPKTSHVGFEITANKENTLAHFFTKINGLEIKQSKDENNKTYDPTLHISGGFTEKAGEYSRPLALHGENIQMYAADGTYIDNNGKEDVDKFLSQTDAGLKISTDEAKLQLGSTYFNLFRGKDDEQINSLMTTTDLKINVGKENLNDYWIEEVNIGNDDTSNWQSLNRYYDSFKYKQFNDLDKIKDLDLDSLDTVKNSIEFKYVTLGNMDIYNSQLENGKLKRYYITKNNKIYSNKDTSNMYYKIQDTSSYFPINLYDDVYYKKGKELKTVGEVFKIESSQYIGITKEEFLEINQNNINNYFVQVPRTEQQQFDSQFIHVKETILNTNMYYFNNDTRFGKIDNINDIYCKRLKDNNTEIFLLEKYMIDNVPIIEIIGSEIEPSSGNPKDIWYYKYNEFDDTLYFKIRHNDKEFYVTNFTVTFSDGTIENFSSKNESNWNYEKYKNAIISFNDENENEIKIEIGEREDVLDFFITEGPINNYILNTYKKYNGDDIGNNPRYILKNKIEGATKYYQYINNNERFLYKKNISEDEDEKQYYKIINSENKILYRETSGAGVLLQYYTDKGVYIPSSNINYNDFYKIIDGEYILDPTATIDERYLLVTIGDDISDFEWVRLDTWTNSDYNVYCKDEDNNYIARINILTKELYINVEETYELVKSENFDNFNYIRLKDNIYDKNFFVLIDHFNTVMEDTRNRWLLSNNNFYNIGWEEGKWKINEEGDIQENEKNTKLRRVKVFSSFSDKAYSLYNGSYKNYIQNETHSTKIDINEKINIRNTRLIDLYSNNNLNITISNVDKMILNDDEDLKNIPKIGNIYLGKNLFDGEMYNEDHIWGQFVHIENDVNKYGMILTSNSTYLLGKAHTQIKAAETLELIAQETGNGNTYGSINPQLVLKTGEGKNINQIILNSSNNGWKTVNDKNLSAYPIFQVKTRYSNIGIFPQYSTKKHLNAEYTENFVVNMNQVISHGLSIQGIYNNNSNNIGLSVAKNIKAKKFIGTDWRSIFNIKGETTKGKESLSFGSHNDEGYFKIKPPIGGSSTFKIPFIKIMPEGQPIIKNSTIEITLPDADSIWSKIEKKVAEKISNQLSNKGFLTAAAARELYVTKDTFNKHRHQVVGGLTVNLVANKETGKVNGSVSINTYTEKP